MTPPEFVAAILTLALAIAAGVIWRTRSLLDTDYTGRHRR